MPEELTKLTKNECSSRMLSEFLFNPFSVCCTYNVHSRVYIEYIAHARDNQGPVSLNCQYPYSSLFCMCKNDV